MKQLSLEGLNFSTTEVNIKDKVMTITLDRPEKKNAMNNVMMNEINYLLAYAKQEKDIRVVVFAANGDIFCAGADLSRTESKSNVPILENSDDIKNDIVSEDQNIDDNIEIEEENETFSMDSELTDDQNEKNEIEETSSEEEIKKIDERAIFGGSNSSSNSKSASAAGSSLEMQGWTWDFEPNPNDNSSESGRIIFEIIVDYYGEIVGLKTLETTLSPMVENIYREEILKLTFSPTNNNNPADISKGKITFIIKNN